ncbi:MAG: hypothetical protein Q8942_19145 [Bacillota bacterium]|nr:hypothetical protein [Bacillota bacterium]
MAFRFRSPSIKLANSDSSISSILEMIKFGDTSMKNKFIGEYKPFIKRVVSDVTPITGFIEDSDEYSVALIAFNEAIDCYDENKNCLFIKFAELVIRRRLLDYVKLNSKISGRELPFSYFSDDSASFVDRISPMNCSQSDFERIEIIQEMKKLTELLKDYKINIKDLPNCTPKHLDSRELALKIARVIVNNRNLAEKLILKRHIPYADVIKVFDVHPKTIQRNKKYIISLCLILIYGLEHLLEFIGGKGGSI